MKMERREEKDLSIAVVNADGSSSVEDVAHERDLLPSGKSGSVGGFFFFFFFLVSLLLSKGLKRKEERGLEMNTNQQTQQRSVEPGRTGARAPGSPSGERLGPSVVGMEKKEMRKKKKTEDDESRRATTVSEGLKRRTGDCDKR